MIHMGKTQEGTLTLLELDLRCFTKLSLAVDSRSVPEVPWDGNLWEWRESSCQTGWDLQSSKDFLVKNIPCWAVSYLDNFK